MEALTEFELEILEILPVEPIGVSLAELADDLLNNRNQQAKGRIKRALKNIRKTLGGLYVHSGDDDFGCYGVKMYGIPRAKMPAVREFFAAKTAQDV